jgi:hypothetical protein
VSTSDVHSSLDVVVPVDGHQTIIGKNLVCSLVFRNKFLIV